MITLVATSVDSPQLAAKPFLGSITPHCYSPAGTGSPMPSGEDSDTANDYPQRCERARKQTLSNNTAP